MMSVTYRKNLHDILNACLVGNWIKSYYGAIKVTEVSVIQMESSDHYKVAVACKDQNNRTYITSSMFSNQLMLLGGPETILPIIFKALGVLPHYEAVLNCPLIKALEGHADDI